MPAPTHMSLSQKETIVDFMETHGDLLLPREAARGREEAGQLWQQLASLLNADGTGPHKSVDRWKKVWSDMKCAIKKKYIMIRKDQTGTGGGPSSNVHLDVISDRVVAIMGLRNIIGGPSEEVGFNIRGLHIQQDHDYVEAIITEEDDGNGSLSSSPHEVQACSHTINVAATD